MLANSNFRSEATRFQRESVAIRKRRTLTAKISSQTAIPQLAVVATEEQHEARQQIGPTKLIEYQPLLDTAVGDAPASVRVSRPNV